MSAYLGQDGTLEERGSEFHQNELGKLNLENINFEKIGNVFKSGGDLFGNLFGGTNCSAADKQRRGEMAVQIQQYLTPTDRRQLVNIAHADIAPTSQAMARFFLGGKDCKHKNVHPDDQQFLDRLPGLIQQRQAEQQQSSGLPSNMSVSTAGVSPAAKYLLIAFGLSALAGSGYYGYKEYLEDT